MTGADDGNDADEEARADALHVVLRRVAIWTVPLFVLGAFLVALGIPLWLSTIAMFVVLIVVVLELS